VAVSERLELARLHLAAGVVPELTEQLPERSRRAVAVAAASGAGVLEGLDGAAAAEIDARRAQRAIGVACAQTRAVAVGLLVAPVVLVPFLGRALGADLVGFYARPVGWAVAGVVLVLLAAGAAGVWGLLRRARGALAPTAARPSTWPTVLAAVVTGWALTWWLAPLAAFLVARRRPSQPPPADVDEIADLLATALGGGTSPARAVREVAGVREDVADHLGRLALDLDLGLPDGRHPAPLDRVATLLHAAHDAGAPPAGALRRLAAELRADDLARALAAAERLPAQLTFPTALALLPAVLLAIGAPIAYAGLSAAAGIR
jgi:hypothetical protein